MALLSLSIRAGNGMIFDLTSTGSAQEKNQGWNET